MFAPLNSYVPNDIDKQAFYDVERLIQNKEFNIQTNFEASINPIMNKKIREPISKKQLMPQSPKKIERDKSKLDDRTVLLHTHDEEAVISDLLLDQTINIAKYNDRMNRLRRRDDTIEPDTKRSITLDDMVLMDNDTMNKEYEHEYIVGEVPDDDTIEDTIENFIEREHPYKTEDEKYEVARKLAQNAYKGIIKPKQRRIWNLNEAERLDNQLLMSFDFEPEKTKLIHRNFNNRHEKSFDDELPQMEMYIDGGYTREQRNKNIQHYELDPDGVEHDYYNTVSVNEPKNIRHQRDKNIQHVNMNPDTMYEYHDVDVNHEMNDREYRPKNVITREQLTNLTEKYDESERPYVKPMMSDIRVGGINRAPRTEETIDDKPVLETIIPNIKSFRLAEKNPDAGNRTFESVKKLNERYNSNRTDM